MSPRDNVVASFGVSRNSPPSVLRRPFGSTFVPEPRSRLSDGLLVCISWCPTSRKLTNEFNHRRRSLSILEIVIQRGLSCFNCLLYDIDVQSRVIQKKSLFGKLDSKYELDRNRKNVEDTLE